MKESLHCIVSDSGRRRRVVVDESITGSSHIAACGLPRAQRRLPAAFGVIA
jgi:hypothetical protein